MRIKTIITIIAGFIFAIASPFVAIAVNETPHNASKTVSCGNCHGKALLYSPFWGGSYTPANIDDTVYNKICLECHTQPSGPYTTTGAPLARTHSSLATDAGYGNWTRECRDCHNPHYQKQSLFKRTDSSNLYLATGTITAYVYNGDGTSTLTHSGITYKTATGWDSAKLLEKTGSFRRAMLVPNVGKLGYNYPITAIDGTTIKVEGDATATYQYISPPTTFAVMYGQYVKDLINVSGINKTVKFLDRTGTKSFADGDTTYDGVCEVCHTQTTHFRNNGGGSDPNHANIGGAGGTNCISCHTHPEGFKASCNACHGYPPIVNSATSPDGLVWILPVTGSATSGAHNLHVNTKSYQCDICHYQNITQNKHNKDPRVITLGFYMFSGAYQGGSYDGQASPNYNATTTTPPTTVSKLGAKTCNNLYCHGGTMAPNGGTAQAVWDVPASAVCGTCHGASTGAPPQRGSHLKHAGSASGGRQLACTVCHKGYTSVHVNGSANWAYDTTTYTWLSGALYRGSASGSATPVPGASYGTCTNLYCHSQGTSNTSPYPAPNIAATWGGALDSTCTGCHSGDKNATNKIASGSHTKHVVSSSIDCTKCHNQTASNSRTISNQANHVNNLVNVAYDAFSNPGGNGTYNGTVSPMIKTPGTAYGNCTNIYCHGSGAPVWGGAAIACDGCHKASNALPQSHGKHYENAPAVTSNQTGRDASALYLFRCGNCHNPAATTHAGGMANPPNRASEISFSGGGTYTQGATNLTDPEGFKYTTGGTCATTACHQDGQGGVPLQTATWQGTVTNPGECVYCHKGNAATTNAAWRMSTGKHTQHMNQAAVLGTNFECVRCHNTTVSAGSDRAITNKDNHVNGTRTVSFSNAGTWTAATFICSSMYCHSSGQATPNYRTVAAWNSATTYDCKACHGADAAFVSKAGEPNYANGGAGAANANSHDAHVSIAGDCDTCHTNTTTTGTSIKAGSLLHINTLREVTFNTTKAGASATYTAATKTCSTISCHGGGSAQWGAILGCSGCHSYDTVAGSWGSNPQAIEGFGAHAKHIDHIKARFSVTLSATTDTFGTGAAAKVCGTCHTNNSANHSNSTRTINFGDGTYKEGGAAGFSFLFDPAAPGINPPLYNGVTGNSSAVNPKSCSAVGCHFTTTPVWSSY